MATNQTDMPISSLKALLNRQIFKRGPWTVEDAQNHILAAHDLVVPWRQIEQALDELVRDGEITKSDGSDKYRSITGQKRPRKQKAK